jgi:hypothetical protein
MLLQPSPSTVLPWSHVSVTAMIPSPQTALQTLGCPKQAKPTSTVQDPLQPSPESELPSSQLSAASV